MPEDDVTRAELAALASQIEAVGDRATQAADRADEAAKIASETHALVLEVHRGLMQPPAGQDKSLLYQFAHMLEDWKRHKWAFQIVITLAGAAGTVAAAYLAIKTGILGEKP